MCLQKQLDENDPQQERLDGALSLTKACLIGSRDALSGQFDGVFTIYDANVHAEVVQVKFSWHLDGQLLANTVIFAHDSARLDEYFLGIKFTLGRKLEFVLNDFEKHVPELMHELLVEAGWSFEHANPVGTKPVKHIETDWDVLS